MIEYYKKAGKDEILLKIGKFSKDCWIKCINLNKDESTSSFLFIISENCFLTISKFNLEIFDRIPRFKSFYTDKKTRILLLFLSTISKSFWESSRDILKSVRRNKINISQFNNHDLFKLVIHEDVLNDYL